MAKQQEDDLKIGDFVWAKLKGYPLWPGRIESPSPLKKGGFNVFFFGTHDYSLVVNADLKPYEKLREKYGSNIKAPNVKRAFLEAEEWLANGGQPPQHIQEQIEKEKTERKRHEEEEKKEREENKEKAESIDHDDETAEAGFEALVKMDESFCPTTPAGNPKSVTKRKVSDIDLPPKKKFKIKMELSGTSTPTAKAQSSSPDPKKKPSTPSASNKSVKKTAVTPKSDSTSKSTSSKTTNTKSQSTSSQKSTSSHKSSKVSSSQSPKMNGDVNKAKMVVTVNCPWHPEHLKSKPAPKLHLQEQKKVSDIKPSPAKIGFIGLGGMATNMIRNLLRSGHDVTIWNRTLKKCTDMAEHGACVASNPGELFDKAEIIFSCVSDPSAVKEIFFTSNIYSKICAGKSYVEMSGIDAETSKDLADAIVSQGGRYLEAQLHGSREDSISGQLIILAAGNRRLFDDGQSCFQAIGKKSLFVGEDIGSAAKMRLILQNISGGILAVLAENLALADRVGVHRQSFVDILQMTSLDSAFLREKGRAIVDDAFTANESLNNLQKDMKLTIAMSEQLDQPLHVTVAANETFKTAKRQGFGSHDSSAVFIPSRF